MFTYKIINIFTDEIIGYFNSDKTYKEIFDNIDFFNTLSMYFCCDLDDITIENVRKRETGLLINNTIQL